MGSEDDPATRDVSICVGCGLCCDGTVLTHLAVADDSDLGRPLAALGVEVVVAADPPVVELPCPAFDGRCCSVHDLHRPRACAAYECDLLRAVHGGAVSPADARRVVVATRALRDRVREGRASPEELEAAVARHFRATGAGA